MDQNQNPYENGNTTGFPNMQRPDEALDNNRFADRETQNLGGDDNISNPGQSTFLGGRDFEEGGTHPQKDAVDGNRNLYSENSYDPNSPASGGYSKNIGAQGGNASYQYVSGSGIPNSNAQNPYGQNPYGQNPYAQNPYIQNPATENPYQQNPYMQNGYAQNANTHNAYNQQPFSSNVYQQRPYAQGQNVYQPSYQPETEEPVSLLDWVGTILLGAVPCVGLIMYIIWAFSNDTKKSKANYCKASLILMLSVVALYIIVVVIMMGAVFSPWYY